MRLLILISLATSSQAFAHGLARHLLKHHLNPSAVLSDDDDDDFNFGKRDEFAEIAAFAEVMSREEVMETEARKEQLRVSRLSVQKEKIKAAAEAAKRKALAGAGEDADNSITRGDDDRKTRTWSN